MTTDLNKLGVREVEYLDTVVKENAAGTKFFATELKKRKEIGSFLKPKEVAKLPKEAVWKKMEGGKMTCIIDGRRFVADLIPEKVSGETT